MWGVKGGVQRMESVGSGEYVWPSDLDKWGCMWKREMRVSQKFSDSREVSPGWLLERMGTAEPDCCLQHTGSSNHLLLTFAASECSRQTSLIRASLGWVKVELAPSINACLTPDALLNFQYIPQSYVLPHTHSNVEEMRVHINIKSKYWGILYKAVCTWEREKDTCGPLSSFMPEKFWHGIQVLSPTTQGESHLHRGNWTA